LSHKIGAAVRIACGELVRLQFSQRDAYIGMRFGQNNFWALLEIFMK